MTAHPTCFSFLSELVAVSSIPHDWAELPLGFVEYITWESGLGQGSAIAGILFLVNLELCAWFVLNESFDDWFFIRWGNSGLSDLLPGLLRVLPKSARGAFIADVVFGGAVITRFRVREFDRDFTTDGALFSVSET